MTKLKLILIIFALLMGFQYNSLAQDDSLISFPLDSVNEVITKSGVEIDIKNSADGEGSLLVNANKARTIEVAELSHENFKNMRLTYRAKMKSQDLIAKGDMRGISYIELIAKFSNGEELVSRGPRVPIKGTTDWRPVDTVLYIDKGGSPESLKLNLVVEGQGLVWIDDVQLESIPLRINYLFWGHLIVWVILIIYIYELLRKNRHLKKELEALS